MLDLGFVESSRGGRIQIKLSRAGPVRGGAARTTAARCSPSTGVRLPKRLERSLDTSRARDADQDDQHLRRPGRRAKGQGGGRRRRGARPSAPSAPADGLVWHLEAKGTEDRGGGGVEPQPPASPPSRRSYAAQTATGRTRYVGQEGVLRVQGHRHPQPAAGHRRGQQEEHRRRRRRDREDHHPPPQRPLGPGAGHHPGQQGPGEGGDRQHHPRRAAEDAGGGGALARGAEEGAAPAGGPAWCS